MTANKKHFIRIITIIVILLLIGVGIFIFTKPSFAPIFDSQSSTQQTSTGSGAATSETDDQSPIDDSRITAKSYLVYTTDTQAILAAKSPETPVAIASLTKLMTGYLVYRYGTETDTITVTQDTTLNISPVIGLTSGEMVTVHDLFNSMLIGSANDAALTLGKYLANKTNKNIITLMNDEAASLGMTNTHFSNPIGFDSDTNYSTAKDLQLLIEAMGMYPAFSELDRMQSYSFTGKQGTAHYVRATNTLISKDRELHAVKTGHTDEAKGAMINRVDHNGHSFIIIILNSDNREQDTILLKAAIIKQFYP